MNESSARFIMNYFRNGRSGNNNALSCCHINADAKSVFLRGRPSETECGYIIKRIEPAIKKIYSMALNAALENIRIGKKMIAWCNHIECLSRSEEHTSELQSH